jgi:Delta7-sterol 5-desaturase
MEAGPILDTWRQALTVDFLRYFLTAAPFYAVFWMWRPAWARGRRIQSVDPGRRQVLSEVVYSLSTIVIFSAIGVSLFYAQQAGLTRIYVKVAERGWTYFAASIAAAMLAHDAYFYWTHRILHWRPLFRLAHHVHHRSTSPTPWAAYAFHPLEALIQAGVYVLIVFAIPIHPLALMLFLVYMIVRNVVGHLGFELWPAGFARHPLTRWHLTPTHHDLHHRFGKGNYGLYFSFWDDWMETGRSDYRATYDAVTAPPAVERCTSAAVRVAVCLLAFVAAPRPVQAEDLSPEGRWTTVDDHTARTRIRSALDAAARATTSAWWEWRSSPATAESATGGLEDGSCRCSAMWSPRCLSRTAEPHRSPRPSAGASARRLDACQSPPRLDERGGRAVDFLGRGSAAERQADGSHGFLRGDAHGHDR